MACFASLSSICPSLCPRSYREIHFLKVVSWEGQHPFIPSLRHVGVAGGSIYVLLDYINGACLSSFPNAGLGLREEEAKYVCLCLSYTVWDLSVNYGLIHRDIKPGNILFDAKGRVKLVDFNLAAALGDDGYLEPWRVGTEQYMAPEVKKLQRYNYKADLCSLGLTLGRMSGFSPVAIASGDLSGPGPKWSQAGKEVLLSLLQEDPEARPTFEEILAKPWIKSTYGNHSNKLRASLQKGKIVPPKSLVESVECVAKKSEEMKDPAAERKKPAPPAAY